MHCVIKVCERLLGRRLGSADECDARPAAAHAGEAGKLLLAAVACWVVGHPTASSPAAMPSGHVGAPVAHGRVRVRVAVGARGAPSAAALRL